MCCYTFDHYGKWPSGPARVSSVLLSFRTVGFPLYSGSQPGQPAPFRRRPRPCLTQGLGSFPCGSVSNRLEPRLYPQALCSSRLIMSVPTLVACGTAFVVAPPFLEEHDEMEFAPRSPRAGDQRWPGALPQRQAAQCARAQFQKGASGLPGRSGFLNVF
jgi:hypothetical protein